MSQKTKIANGLDWANILVERFEPACERIEIGGSLRRGIELVHDIEIVAMPRRRNLGLFPGQSVSELNGLLIDMVTMGKLKSLKNGTRYKQFEIQKTRPPIQLDLFLATPDNWGLIFALRTGPASLSKRMVTQRRKGGLLSDSCRVDGGYVWGLRPGSRPLWDDHERCMEVEGVKYHKLSVPEEFNFFELLAIDYIEPEDRK